MIIPRSYAEPSKASIRRPLVVVTEEGPSDGGLVEICDCRYLKTSHDASFLYLSLLFPKLPVR